eukprot:COSAG01_NODE_2486_length_7593_cov_2.425674_7_plen_160_part_00
MVGCMLQVVQNKLRLSGWVPKSDVIWQELLSAVSARGSRGIPAKGDRAGATSKILDDMQACGIQPSLELYTLAVNLCARSVCRTSLSARAAVAAAAAAAAAAIIGSAGSHHHIKPMCTAPPTTKEGACGLPPSSLSYALRWLVTSLVRIPLGSAAVKKS